MDQAWVREEQRLWNLMMDPGYGQRRRTAHSMAKGPVRKAVEAEIAKQAERDFAAGWRTYDTWVKH